MNAPSLPVGFDPAGVSLLVNEPVVTQHADDAAFLWTVRDRAVNAPHFRLKDLTRWDERVEAHLDGLRIAGDFGWLRCEAALAEHPGRIFAGAVLAFGNGDPARITTVLEAGIAEPELARPLVSALGWLDFEAIESRIATLTRSENPEIRRAGIAAFAVHRRDPGAALDRALGDPDARLRRRAIAAAGELGKVDLLPAIVPLLSDSRDELRFEAARTAALLGDRSSSIAVLETMAQGDTALAEPAVTLLVRVMPLDRALAAYRAIRARAAHSRLAARVAGVIGAPDLVADLLGLMAEPAAARAAGEAVSAITGVDLEYSDLDGEPPEEKAAADEEIPETGDDDDLPWPSPSRVAEWWKSNRDRFKTGTRYVLGQPLAGETLRQALAIGTQRQRASAAIELALRVPSRPVFETRARGRRQSRILESWTS